MASQWIIFLYNFILDYRRLVAVCAIGWAAIIFRSGRYQQESNTSRRYSNSHKTEKNRSQLAMPFYNFSVATVCDCIIINFTI